MNLPYLIYPTLAKSPRIVCALLRHVRPWRVRYAVFVYDVIDHMYNPDRYFSAWDMRVFPWKRHIRQYMGNEIARILSTKCS